MRDCWDKVNPIIRGALSELGKRVYALSGAEIMVLYGSYAKGTNTDTSDVDLAVFFNDCTDEAQLLERYRRLVRICSTHLLDIQVQAFSSSELAAPCGIIEEIDMYGIVVPRAS